MFEFRNLTVYKKSKQFHFDCQEFSDRGNIESYIRNQLRRAAFSVPLNIAEGSGKFSKADRRNYFTTSRASVFECVAVMDILNDQDLITDDEFNQLTRQADELSRMLYTMMKNLS